MRKKNEHNILAWLFFCFFWLATLLVAAMPAVAQEKRVIGEVEEVVLWPGGVTIGARIDTGAALSSLDVCEFKVKGKVVEFTLPERCGGARYTLPLLGWKRVKSASGQTRRPMVEVAICIAGQKIPTQVTFTDRSQLEYPFLLGRNTLLSGGFVVDVGLSKTSRPACLDEADP